MFLSTALAATMLLLPMNGGASYFEDFEDGVADGWSVVNGDWDVLFGVFQGVGTSWPNNGVHNLAHIPSTHGANYSVEAVMSSDLEFDDVSKMLVLRFNDSNNFYFVNFRAGWRKDVVVERMLNGARTLITPEFAFPIPEHAQGDWKRCRADIIGNRIIAYFEGLAVCDIALPTILIPTGSAGLNVFSSGGGNEELYTDEYSVRPAEFAPAVSLEKIVGGNSSGGLAQVAKEDGTYFQVSPRFDIQRTHPNAQVVWTGQVSLNPIHEATIRFEASTTASTVQQKVEVWDWISSEWDLFDVRNISSTDVRLRFLLTDHPRYISSAGSVKIRASYFVPPTSSRLDIRIDEVNVHVVGQ